ncbi:hypothetical protein ACWCXC_31425 [Streptomyces sp. NPDC001515]
MADTDLIKMRLTFWRDGKQPGDVIDVRADEAHRWTGFAVAVTETKQASKATTAPATPAEQSKAGK